MKKLFLILLLTTGTFVARAYDYPYLTLKTADGTTTSVSVEDLKLTFDDGELVLTNSEGSVTLTLSELSTMCFAESTSDISTDIQSLPVDEGVEVYTTGGVFVGRYESISEAKSTLRQGIYVMKTNTKSFKSVVK